MRQSGLVGTINEFWGTNKEKDAIREFSEGFDIGIWEWNLLTEDLWYANYCKELLGLNENEDFSENERYYDRKHPDEIDAIRKNIDSITSGKKEKLKQDIRLRTQSGRYIWVQERIVVSGRDGDGNVTNLSGIIRDVTDIRMAELKAEQELYYLAQSTSLFGIGTWYWDVPQNQLTFSDNCAVILKRDKSQLDGSLEQEREFMVEESYHNMTAKYAKWFSEGGKGVLSQEVQLIDGEGKIQWFLESACVTEYDTNDNILRIRGMWQNIDSTIMMRNEIARQNELLKLDIATAKKTSEAMFDNNPHINILSSGDGTVLDCNPAAIDFFDKTTKQELISYLNNFFENEDEAGIKAFYDEALETGISEFITELPGKPSMNVVLQKMEYNGKPALVTYMTERTEADERINRMFNAFPMACNLIDENFKLVDCNDTAIKMLYAPDKKTYLSEYFGMYPEYQPDGKRSEDLLKEKYAEAVEKGNAKFPWTIKYKDGTLGASTITVVALKNKDSFSIVEFIEDQRELTEERAKMREAEAYVQMMLDSTPLICSVWNEKSEVIDCNQEAVKAFEVSNKSEVIANTVKLEPERQTNGERSSDLRIKYMTEAIKKGKANFEWNHYTINGELIPTETTLVCTSWKNSYRILAYSRDLREVMSEKDKTRETENYMQLMLDSTPMVCSIWNEDFEMIDCNMEVVRMFSLKNKEEYSEKFDELNPMFQPDGSPSKEQSRLYLEAALKTGYQKFEWDYFVKATGERISAETTLIRVPYKGGHRILAYSRDTREIKKALRDIEHYTELLHTINVISTNLIISDKSNYAQLVTDQIKLLGEELGINVCKIWERYDENGEMKFRQSYSWSSQAFPVEREFMEPFKYEEVPSIAKRLEKGEPINVAISQLPEEERKLFASYGVKAILLEPIIMHHGIWGFVSYENFINDETLPVIYEDVLNSCGILLASAITRNKASSELIDAKDDLTTRGMLLEALNHIAKILMANNEQEKDLTIQKCVRILGKSIGAERVSLWRNEKGADGVLYSTRLPGWREGETFKDASKLITINLEEYVPEWSTEIRERKAIDLPLRYMNNNLRNMAILQNSQSLLLIPIDISEEFWGFIGLSHQEQDYAYTAMETDIIRSGAMMIAEAVIRNEVNEKLVNAMNEALSSVRSKNEFLARMSHEIRTPLNAIIGMASIAAHSKANDKINEYLDIILASSKRLLHIVNDVLDMSNIEREKLSIDIKEFDFIKMLKRTIADLRLKADAKRQNLILNINHPLKNMVMSDEHRVIQIITNLVNNAVKFTEESGTIMVDIDVVSNEAKETRLIIKVKDTGIGITDELLSKIFDPFEQGDGSITRKYGGSGLGLPLCKAITEMLKGTIDVSSELGKGSLFTVTIPISWGDPCKEIEPVKISENMRILVVDDMPDVLAYMKNILKEFSLSCDVVDDKHKAKNMIIKAQDEGASYDVICLDWFLYEQTSGDLAKYIKELEPAPAVVLMSVADKSALEDDIDALGIKYFIKKPFRADELFDMLAKIAEPRHLVEESRKTTNRDKDERDWSGKEILLVEDGEVNRMIVTKLLSKTKVQIGIAVNGKEAVDMYNNNPEKYDLILMDIQMPVMDGLEATREIRKNNHTHAKKIPIYALTAHTFASDKEACLKAGMDGHIAKPIDRTLLLDTLDCYL